MTSDVSRNALTCTSDVSDVTLHKSPKKSLREGENPRKTSETSETSGLLPDLDEPRVCTGCLDTFADLGFDLCTPCALEGAPA